MSDLRFLGLKRKGVGWCSRVYEIREQVAVQWADNGTLDHKWTLVKQ